MKLASFIRDGRNGIGVVVGDRLQDLAGSGVPDNLLDFIRQGESALSIAASLDRDGIALEDVELRQPVLRPGKILAIGLNYGEHIAETGGNKPAVQMWFNKQTTCVNGPFDPIHLPAASDKLDYEGELAVIIGRRCRHVPGERAAEVVAGYCIINDVSVRDWQRRSQTMQIGKSFDTHGPMGPWLVTPEEVGDPHALDLKTWVNGELRQDSNTRHLIYNIWEQIEHLTTAFTLEPGDVLATGTPSGVGAAMNPPSFLKEGDVVRIEIEKLGAIECTVVREPGEMVIE